MALNAPTCWTASLSVNTDAVIAYLAAQRRRHIAGRWSVRHLGRRAGVRRCTANSRCPTSCIAGNWSAAKAPSAPLILFGKGNAPYLEDLAASGTDAVGVDWLIELGDAAHPHRRQVALRGNLDPATLYGSPTPSACGPATPSTAAAGNGGAPRQPRLPTSATACRRT